MGGSLSLNPPEGWYPDPQGIAFERYFDGEAWTTKTRSESTPPAARQGEGSLTFAAGAGLSESARRVSAVADALAWLLLVLGVAGAAILAIAAMTAVGDYRNSLHTTWPYALILAAGLLVNAVFAWILLRSIGIATAYVSIRVRSKDRYQA